MPRPPDEPLATLLSWSWTGRDDAFVCALGLLVLLRTIEARGPAWLPPGSVDRRPLASLAADLGLPAPEASPDDLAQLVAAARSLDLSALPFRHVGRVHEHLRAARRDGPRSHRRQHGQFYTPPELADLLVRQALPEVPPGALRVADLAAGSGELLAAALRWIGGGATPGAHPAPRDAGRIIGDMVAIDLDPTALLLTRLHLLHTAALLDLPLQPPLPAPTLLLDDTLTADLSAAGPLDLILGNPPFSDQPAWLRARRLPPELALIRPHNNRATAFLLRALPLLRPGGRLGFILPNQLLSAPGEAAARDHVAKTLSLTWILNNRGAALFPGVGVPACVVVGQRGPADGLRLTTLTSPAAELAGLWTSARHEHLPCPTDDRWLPDPLAHRPDLRPAAAVHRLQRGPIPGNGPLADCWRVTRVRPGLWRHALSGRELSLTPDEEASALRPVTPDLLDGVHALDPTLPDGERLLLPPAVPTPVQDDLRLRAARLLREAEEATMYAWYLRLAGGEMVWFRRSGFTPGRPFVLWSRLATLTPGREMVRGAVFSGRQPVVPGAGNVSWVESVPHGLALLAVWNSAPVFEQLRSFAPSRHTNTAELTGGLAKRVRLPGLEGLVRRLEGVEEISLGELARLGGEVW